MNIPEIDLNTGLVAYESGKTTFLDIRRPNDRTVDAIPGSEALSDGNIDQFVSTTPKNQPLVVYCYHGISSRGATAYLMENGFTDVSSLRGGFEGWQSAGHPTTRGANR